MDLPSDLLAKKPPPPVTEHKDFNYVRQPLTMANILAYGPAMAFPADQKAFK